MKLSARLPASIWQHLFLILFLRLHYIPLLVSAYVRGNIGSISICQTLQPIKVKGADIAASMTMGVAANP